MDSYNIDLSAENDEREIFLDVTETGENLDISTEDYTPVGVTSVNGKKGKVILTTSDLDNTSGYQTKTQVDVNISDKIDNHNNSSSAHPYIQGRVNAVQSQVNTQEERINAKQDRLVSGTNIKTINNESILGSGNLTIESGAEYGFTGIITGTAANPTDGASLANGTYLADPSKATSYINLDMEDGTTRRQSAPKGSVIIRTAGRLIVLGTQNLMYSYNTSLHYFYEPESFVEAYVRVTASDEHADIGTLSSPNNKIVIGDIYSLEGIINTGETSHARVIFKVVDDLQGEPFEYNITTSDDEPILYEDGAVPEFKEGMTYILEFYGHNCEIFGFKEQGTRTRDELLKQFMRQNSNQIYYPDLDGKPNFSIQTAAGNAEDNRNVNITNSDVYLSSFHNLQYYGINATMIPLDLSLYNVNTLSQQLQPNTQLPDGVYYVTNQGRLHIGTTDIGSYLAKPGEMIFKDGTELVILGYYAACYFTWNSTDQAYEGGYFTTTLDVEYMLEGYDKGMTVSKSATATGTIAMTDHRWTRKTRAAGINSGTINFPSEETIDDSYKSRLTCKTSSSFTSFTISSRSYTIYFIGDDCSNGTITASAGKYYDMHAEADGFGGVLVHVTSYTLST